MNAKHVELLCSASWNQDRPERPELFRADLRGLDLAGKDLSRTNLAGANLEGANLNDARLSHAWLSGSNFRKASLCRANLDGAIIRCADFTCARLQGAWITRVDGSGADFTSANLRESSLADSRFIGSRFDDACLDDATLCDACLAGSSMHSTSLRRSKLTRAILNHAKLDQADLSDANLGEAFLNGTRLKGARLRGACLERAIFLQADLRHADLSGALMVGTVIDATDLASVVGMSDVQHIGPSVIGPRTLAGLHGMEWAVAFLKGCGIGDLAIAAVSSGGLDCAHAFLRFDDVARGFALRLHDALQVRGFRCWSRDEKSSLPRAARGAQDLLIFVIAAADLTEGWLASALGDEGFVRAALLESSDSAPRPVVIVNSDNCPFEEWVGLRPPEVLQKLDYHEVKANGVSLGAVEQVADAIRALRL